MKNFLVISLVALLLPFSAYAEDKKKDAPAPRPSLVQTVAIKKGMVNPLQLFVGTIYYNETSKVASATEGLVKELNFDEGDVVEEGFVLVTLDREKLEANIAADKASYKGIQSDLRREEKNIKRLRALLKQKSISQTVFDDTYYTVEKLRQQLNTLTAQIKAKEIEWEEKNIKAPIPGVIVKRSTQKGEWVAKGNIIANMVNTNVIDAVFYVPSRFLAQVTKGEAITVTVEGKTYDGAVHAIIPSGDLITRTFPLKVRIITDKQIPEGVTCSIQLQAIDEKEAFVVPRDAVIKRFGQDVIFLDNKGMAQMSPVKVVGYNGTMVAIAGQGIQPGMMVVTKGNERIFPNMPIMAIPPATKKELHLTTEDTENTEK